MINNDIGVVITKQNGGIIKSGNEGTLKSLMR